MNRIDSILKSAGIDDSLSVKKIHYALTLLRNEITKLVIIGVIFALVGSGIEFLFSIAMLLPLRTFSGGMHLETNIGCFIYSFVFFFLAIKVLPALHLHQVVLFFLLFAAAASIAAISPVASYKRPIKTSARRISLKKRALICLTMEVFVLVFILQFAAKGIFVIGVWVVILQAVQLIATWAYRKLKGEGKNVGENQEVELMVFRSGGD